MPSNIILGYYFICS